MKKLLSILLALAMVLSLGSAAFAAEHTITSQDFPLYMGDEDTGETMTLYFVDGVTDLPYMEASDWLDLLNDTRGDEAAGINFTLSISGPLLIYTRNHPDSIEDGTFMAIDYEKDTIEFMDYNLFFMNADASTALDVTSLSFFNEDGEPSLIQKVGTGTLDRLGDVLTLPLREYGIDLIYQDETYLIPLQTINDFFLSSSVGMSLYYNGQVLMIAAAISPDSEVYYAAPTGERSEALTKYGYGELCMMLDYMYGRKDTHEISSFDDLFNSVGFDEVLKGSDVKMADLIIRRTLTDYLDDNHTDWHAYSYLSGDPDFEVPLGTSDARFREQAKLYFGAREQFYPDGVPGYEEVGNTAYITFDQFKIDDSYRDGEPFYAVEDPNSFADDDTVGLIIKAHALINRENSPIENVVLDLSCNPGGAADTAVFTIAWFLGEASIGMKDTMTGAMCSSDYRADVNRDRQFDEKDTVADKNLFCLISPISFSCGNLVPCFFKESNRVTLLGRTSGGGSCVVLNSSSAWGTSFQISGPRRLSFLKNGAFYDIDRGADPDYTISRPEKYYDRQALTDYINSIY